jgi:hypothetical protein
MPIGPAALAGIEDNGLHWKREIDFAGQPGRLGEEDALQVGDCAAIRDRIVKIGRAWAQRLPQGDLRDETETALDELEMCDDDIDEVRHGMSDL